MKCVVARETLLKPLQRICGVVERKSTLPILTHVLLEAEQHLQLTGTDTEIEVQATCSAQVIQAGSTTLPARKLLDICRTLPEHAELELSCHGDKAYLRSGKSRFQLGSLPSQDFPRLQLDTQVAAQTTPLQAGQLRSVIEHAHYAMAQQDVRYYLNGLLLELGTGRLRGVASDGHRLALCENSLTADFPIIQALISRKAVLELLKQLDDPALEVQLTLSKQALRLQLPEVIFLSKLIDASYPDYNRVIPTPSGRTLTGSRVELREALARVAVLSSDKFNSVVMTLTPENANICLRNPEQEEAQEELTLHYHGEGNLEVGYNVKYILDAINALAGEHIQLDFAEHTQAALLRDPNEPSALAVVMPMRI